MRRKENERVRCMKAMISASLYDTCLYFVRMEVQGNLKGNIPSRRAWIHIVMDGG